MFYSFNINNNNNPPSKTMKTKRESKTTKTKTIINGNHYYESFKSHFYSLYSRFIESSKMSLILNGNNNGNSIDTTTATTKATIINGNMLKIKSNNNDNIPRHEINHHSDSSSKKTGIKRHDSHATLKNNATSNRHYKIIDDSTHYK